MSMVERVMAALRDEVGGLVDEECLDIMARAAIEAMREPTPVMLSAGSMRGAYPELAEGYTAMIDAALAEAGEGR